MALDAEHVRAHFQVVADLLTRLPTPINKKGATR